MAFTSIPTDLYTGMTYASGSLIIPLTSLTSHGLDAAKSHPATGDPRTIAYALHARAEEWYAGLATGARPKSVTVKPHLGIGVQTGDFPDAEKTQLTMVAYRVRPTGLIEAEPA